MLALLEWVADHPNRWHDIGKLPETLKAAELLEKRGVIEVRRSRYMLMKASDGEWKPLTTVRTRPAASNGSVGGAQSVVARVVRIHLQKADRSDHYYMIAE